MSLSIIVSAALALVSGEPDRVETLTYGRAPEQIVKVYRPSGEGPHPVFVTHLWLCYDSTGVWDETFPDLVEDWNRRGFAVWAIGGRCDRRRGYSYADFAAGYALLEQNAPRLRLDTTQIHMMGEDQED